MVCNRCAMMIEVRFAVSTSQRVLDQLLGVGVDAGGGFVEHQDLRVRRQHPGEGQQLPLTL
jgi:hypothetical protein